MNLPFRIGHGYDVHAFKTGDFLILGGVEIPFDRAIDAHSDGDLISHALMDAILGALALRDIGHWFSDTRADLKGISSLILLEEVCQKMHDAGYHLMNADITVIAQRPKLASWIDQIKESLIQVIQCSSTQLNIKATTTEKLGFIGREEGLACEAVVLLQLST
jgi:2-C-methyl-D-erythritol 2,4-cyclodiphosphate synthase